MALREYAKRLSEFQRSLTREGPKGLVEALSFEASGLPWACGGRRSWEDWYVVEEFESLGALNEAAVARASKGHHDEMAGMAGGGAGGLYRRVGGGLGLGDARYAAWLGKPERMEYRDFYERVAELAEGGETDLWRRQMALGPAPEFCIHSGTRLAFPEGMAHVSVKVKRVGP